MDTESWLQAARALREVALGHAAVARLDEAARYETHGRGATVHGLALRGRREAFTARLGLVLTEEAARAGPVREAAGEVRAALKRCWAEDLAEERPLAVQIDVIDIASAP